MLWLAVSEYIPQTAWTTTRRCRSLTRRSCWERLMWPVFLGPGGRIDAAGRPQSFEGKDGDAVAA